VRDRFLDQEGYPSVTKTGSIGMTDDISVEGIDDPGSGGIEVELQGVHEVPTGLFAFRLGATYELRAVRDSSGFSAVPVGESFGRAPRDAAGIKWNSRQHEYWSLADGGGESAMIEEEHIEWDTQLHSPTDGRTASRFDDEVISEDWLADQNWTYNILTRDDPVSGWSARERCGIIVERAGNHDASERVVRANYTHAWTPADVNIDLEFDDSGPGLSFSPIDSISSGLLPTRTGTISKSSKTKCCTDAFTRIVT
jgi:hypothetical protein